MASPAAASAPSPGLVFEGGVGPGKGKHVVLLAGDEEYRSEESLPMLAKVLAVRHGFRCTVLFSLDRATGEINPDEQTNIPGLAALDSADFAVCAWRFRELPDADMKHFVEFVEAGKPLLALRTATHAFAYSRNKESPYAQWSFDSGKWPGGFGQQFLGDTWVSHHGHHGVQSTRGVPEQNHQQQDHHEHPILRGVTDVWGPTDVYGIVRLLPTDTVVLRGQVLEGMTPDSKPVAGALNEPMMPLLWTRERAVGGKMQRLITSTIGAAIDLKSEGLRRAFVNTVYWGLGMEAAIDPKSSVEPVGAYEPSMFGFGTWKRGVKVADHALPAKQ
ncbi:MAG: hypothetical protein EXS13_10865 [Planctomycetes bacterium]|nr:hypothetical protein [Planctomycetota bacterium]